jgi:hypothetical protein
MLGKIEVRSQESEVRSQESGETQKRRTSLLFGVFARGEEGKPHNHCRAGPRACPGRWRGGRPMRSSNKRSERLVLFSWLLTPSFRASTRRLQRSACFFPGGRDRGILGAAETEKNAGIFALTASGFRCAFQGRIRMAKAPRKKSVPIRGGCEIPVPPASLMKYTIR